MALSPEQQKFLDQNVRTTGGVSILGGGLSQYFEYGGKQYVANAFPGEDVYEKIYQKITSPDVQSDVPFGKPNIPIFLSEGVKSIEQQQAEKTATPTSTPSSAVPTGQVGQGTPSVQPQPPQPKTTPSTMRDPVTGNVYPFPTAQGGTGASRQATPQELQTFQDIQAQFQKILQQAQTQGYADSSEQPSIQKKSQQVQQALQKFGVTSETPPGEVRSLAQEVGGGTSTPLNQAITQFYNSVNSYINRPTVSLVSQYNELLKNSGLSDIQKQLVDTEKVISGTEQDIRDEIQKSGGFATESQVQNMVNTRNKSLIQKYNNLLATEKYKQEYVNTIMDLTKEDQATAEKTFESGIGLQKQIMDTQFSMQQLGLDWYKTRLQFEDKGRNEARDRIQLGVSSGGIANWTPDSIAYWANQAGYSPEEVQAMADSVKNRDSLKTQASLLRLNNQVQEEDLRKSTAQAVIDGLAAPPPPGSFGKYNQQLVGQIHQISPNFDLKKAQLEWDGTKKFYSTINSQQFLNFQFRNNTTLQQIQEVRKLSGELKRFNLVPFNQAQLYVASKGVGPKAQTAAAFIASIGLLKDDLAAVMRFNASPTDSYLKLSQDILNQNYSDVQLNKALDEVEKTLGYRANVIGSLQANLPGTSGAFSPSAGASSVDDLRSKYNY